MSEPARVNFECYQGEAFEDVGWSFAESVLTGKPIDLTGCHFHATVATVAGVVLWDLTDPTGIVVRDPKSGFARPGITAAMTRAAVPGTYPYELFTTFSNGTDRRVTHRGVVTIFAAETPNP